MTLGERVAQMLDRLGISGAALEDRASLPRGYVSRVIRGQRRNIGPEKLQQLADALGVSVRWLMTGADVTEDMDPALRTVLDWHEHAGRWCDATRAAAIGAWRANRASHSQPEWISILDDLERLLATSSRSNGAIDASKMVPRRTR